MKLSEILSRLEAVQTGAASARVSDPDIRQVTCDSREARPGTLFFALAGRTTDGARFALDAARNGASAVISERPIEGLPPEVAAVLVPDARKAMATAAAVFHGNPASAMTLLGVTGTNGKTTTTYLVEAMARACGESIGVVGTVSWRFGEVARDATHTTPESTVLHALLAEMLGAGVGAVVMEVSSHALAQERVHGLSFSAAAFTNLTRDHLDYHGDLESYFATKRRLFFELCAGPAIVNIDDPHGALLADDLTREGRTVWGFTRRGEGAELYLRDARLSLGGIEGTLVTPAGERAIQSPLVGAHNVENILCAAGLLVAVGFPLDGLCTGLARLANIPGRLERVALDGGASGGISAFVDYAHSDDAIARALASLRPYTSGRLLIVFGCGGDRDVGKRPLMGRAAGKADVAIVTSDNPRSEDPMAIIDAILPGLARAGGAEVHVEPDRRKAIELAARIARPGDLVLVAGKGHERWQLVGKEKLPFDDREEVARAFAARGADLDGEKERAP